MEVLRENTTHRVELIRDTTELHQPHRSLGIYRVVNLSTSEVVFSTPNRDKSFGVLEFLSQSQSTRH
jgi:hypothetical protein